MKRGKFWNGRCVTVVSCGSAPAGARRRAPPAGRGDGAKRGARAAARRRAERTRRRGRRKGAGDVVLKGPASRWQAFLAGGRGPCGALPRTPHLPALPCQVPSARPERAGGALACGRSQSAAAAASPPHLPRPGGVRPGDGGRRTGAAGGRRVPAGVGW